MSIFSGIDLPDEQGFQPAVFFCFVTGRCQSPAEKTRKQPESSQTHTDWHFQDRAYGTHCYIYNVCFISQACKEQILGTVLDPAIQQKARRLLPETGMAWAAFGFTGTKFQFGKMKKF